MERKKELLIDIYKYMYILITSTIIYLIIQHIIPGRSILITLTIRIYYIVCSLILFILLKQVKKYKQSYIYDIIHYFFGFIIIISFLGFTLNINRSNIYVFNYYITISKQLILGFETVIAYSLSKHALDEKRANIIFYIILATSVLSSMFYVEQTNILIAMIYIPTLIIVVLKLIHNLVRLAKQRNSKLIYVLIAYVLVSMYIEINSLLNCYNQIDVKIEILHLINFRVVWIMFISSLVRKPYVNLSESLKLKNNELDELNLQIAIKNVELEKSIATLKRKENLNYMLFRFMPDPILITNAENDRIIFANNQFLELAEIKDSKSIINKKINKYINFIKDDNTSKDYNAIYCKDNKKKFLQTIFLKDYSDENVNLLLIKDNTSKVQTKEIKQELERKRNEEHMRTQFLSSISHDLKTPINVIYSASQVEEIYLKKGEIENLKKYNGVSKQNCISLIKLTNNLIDNSQIKSHYLSAHLEKHNVVQIIEDNVMALVDYVKWNDIDLIFDTNTEECYLTIDVEFMERIILNLVSNAAKHTPPNGKIYVTINKKEEHIEVSVKDTGTGIKEEFIDKAFERYAVGEHQKVDSKSGTGIGLFVVKEMVELQNGRIFIEKYRKFGTNVVMEFPNIEEN